MSIWLSFYEQNHETHCAFSYEVVIFCKCDVMFFKLADSLTTFGWNSIEIALSVYTLLLSYSGVLEF